MDCLGASDGSHSATVSAFTSRINIDLPLLTADRNISRVLANRLSLVTFVVMVSVCRIWLFSSSRLRICMMLVCSFANLSWAWSISDAITSLGWKMRRSCRFRSANPPSDARMSLPQICMISLGGYPYTKNRSRHWIANCHDGPCNCSQNTLMLHGTSAKLRNRFWNNDIASASDSTSTLIVSCAKNKLQNSVGAAVKSCWGVDVL